MCPPALTCAALLTLPLLGSVTGGAELPQAPPPKSPAQKYWHDASVVLQRLASGAEVHAVGVYEPAHRPLCDDDIRDWTKLVEGLKAKTAAAEWLRRDKRFDEVSRAALADPNAVQVLGTAANPCEFGTEAKRISVRHDLSKFLDDRLLCEQDGFRGLKLDVEGNALRALGKKRTPVDVRRLNQLLLGAALPGGLNPPGGNTDTVHIRVKAGRTVLLVLMSHVECRWDVTLDDGAVISAVILAGYAWQKVEGVVCPVYTMTHYGADGESAFDGEASYFGAFQTGTKEYKEMAEKVQQLTLRTIDRFQGEYRQQKPFVVTPGVD